MQYGKLTSRIALKTVDRFGAVCEVDFQGGLNTEICSAFTIGRQRVYNTSKQKHSLAVNTIARQQKEFGNVDKAPVWSCSDTALAALPPRPHGGRGKRGPPASVKGG